MIDMKWPIIFKLIIRYAQLLNIGPLSQVPITSTQTSTTNVSRQSHNFIAGDIISKGFHCIIL